MEIYLVYEDTDEGRTTYAFIDKEKASKRYDEIISKYPEHLRTRDALYRNDIYVGIDSCELEDYDGN